MGAFMGNLRNQNSCFVEQPQTPVSNLTLRLKKIELIIFWNSLRFALKTLD